VSALGGPVTTYVVSTFSRTDVRHG
jgi:hypothetical protein